VGELKLHVEGHISRRKALLITGRWISGGVYSEYRADVLATMVACAEQIAVRLHAAGTGNGCLDWQLEPNDVDVVQRLFSDYAPRKRAIRRGKRYLRKRLIDA
jgi:hypothetical protein